MSANTYSLQELEAFTARFYQGRPLLLVPFAYNLIFLALAQGAQASQVVNIAANADFCCIGIRHRAQIGAAQNVGTKTAPFVRMLVTDTGSNEQFSNTAVDLENYSTNDAKNNMLPYPRIVGGRSTLNVQVTNYAPTAETYTTLDVFFEGVLIRAYNQS